MPVTPGRLGGGRRLPVFAPEGRLRARYFNVRGELALLLLLAGGRAPTGHGAGFSPEGALDPSPGFSLGTALPPAQA